MIVTDNNTSALFTRTINTQLHIFMSRLVQCERLLYTSSPKTFTFLVS